MRFLVTEPTTNFSHFKHEADLRPCLDRLEAKGLFPMWSRLHVVETGLDDRRNERREK